MTVECKVCAKQNRRIKPAVLLLFILIVGFCAHSPFITVRAFCYKFKMFGCGGFETDNTLFYVKPCMAFVAHSPKVFRHLTYKEYCPCYQKGQSNKNENKPPGHIITRSVGKMYLASRQKHRYQEYCGKCVFFTPFHRLILKNPRIIPKCLW